MASRAARLNPGPLSASNVREASDAISSELHGCAHHGPFCRDSHFSVLRLVRRRRIRRSDRSPYAPISSGRSSCGYRVRRFCRAVAGRFTVGFRYRTFHWPLYPHSCDSPHRDHPQQGCTGRDRVGTAYRRVRRVGVVTIAADSGVGTIAPNSTCTGREPLRSFSQTYTSPRAVGAGERRAVSHRARAAARRTGLPSAAAPRDHFSHHLAAA